MMASFEWKYAIHCNIFAVGNDGMISQIISGGGKSSHNKILAVTRTLPLQRTIYRLTCLHAAEDG